MKQGTAVPLAAAPLIPMRGALHEHTLLVWLPGPRLLWIADVLGGDPRADPSQLDELSNAIAREHLDVDRIVGAQLAPTRWADAGRPGRTAEATSPHLRLPGDTRSR